MTFSEFETLLADVASKYAEQVVPDTPSLYEAMQNVIDDFKEGAIYTYRLLTNDEAIPSK